MKPGLWRFLDSGPADGVHNMEQDEALARALLAGEEASFLRVYSWQPWAVSLGRHQDPSLIDEGACRADGIGLVRRPTGGRAILHAEELTYCVVLRASQEEVHRVYNMIGLALQAGLRRFGVDAMLERSQPPAGRIGRSPSSVPCFSSSARYEVMWGGKKLVGSAQRRYRDGDGTVVLQHGSILCGPAHLRLADYLGDTDDGVRRRIRSELAERTVTVSAITGESVDTGLLAECMKEGFEEVLGVGMNVSVTASDGNHVSEEERPRASS